MKALVWNNHLPIIQGGFFCVCFCLFLFPCLFGFFLVWLLLGAFSVYDLCSLGLMCTYLGFRKGLERSLYFFSPQTEKASDLGFRTSEIICAESSAGWAPNCSLQNPFSYNLKEKTPTSCLNVYSTGLFVFYICHCLYRKNNTVCESVCRKQVLGE